jgi:hypothetical protein
MSPGPVPPCSCRGVHAPGPGHRERAGVGGQHQAGRRPAHHRESVRGGGLLVGHVVLCLLACCGMNDHPLHFGAEPLLCSKLPCHLSIPVCRLSLVHPRVPAPWHQPHGSGKRLQAPTSCGAWALPDCRFPPAAVAVVVSSPVVIPEDNSQLGQTLRVGAGKLPPVHAGWWREVPPPPLLRCWQHEQISTCMNKSAHALRCPPHPTPPHPHPSRHPSHPAHPVCAHLVPCS